MSWISILKRRDSYRAAFAQFDAARVARFTPGKVETLLANAAIIRNRRKIESAIHNARAFLAVQEECGSFDRYVWQFVSGQPRQNAWKTLKRLPAQTPQSQALSKDLRARGFQFVGPTICYAFMQAVGMVNDHLATCFRHAEVAGLSAK